MSRLSETLTAKANELGITQIELADQLGMSQQAISALFTGSVTQPRKWRELAHILNISEDEMRNLMYEAGAEAVQRGTRKVTIAMLKQAAREKEPKAAKDFDPLPNAHILDPVLPVTKPGRMLPVLGEAVGGDDGEFIFNGSVLDYVACPPSLVNVPNAYSVFIDGESMSPRYRPGEVVYVHPGKPARRGDDVIVQIRPRDDDGAPPHGFVKEFVGWTGNKLVLHQHNPNQPVEFDRDQVVSVHPIVLAGKY
ncbi:MULTISPECIES: helix-turn-helix domain-containing protein [unclassified Sinorhizobium]|uniref:LexA family transcriptional regulator n=1 Tax=unclassified Sinorhizobium TaxID=2613772 RepID=UPI0035268FA1